MPTPRVTNPPSRKNQACRGPRLSLLLLSVFAPLAATRLHAQAAPAATTRGDFQVGAGYTRANPDYSPNSFNGYTVFADLDFLRYLGVLGEFHRISGNTPTISETTYGAGLRLRYPIRRFEPYLKIVGGAGTFTFGQNSQNGTYRMFAGGGGVDYRFSRHIVLRADYEYQRWGTFPPTGLQPNLFTLGAAYRF